MGKNTSNNSNESQKQRFVSNKSRQNRPLKYQFFISLVVPLYNEEESLRPLAHAIQEEMDVLAEGSWKFFLLMMVQQIILLRYCGVTF
jgi:hypothetical protein